MPEISDPPRLVNEDVRHEKSDAWVGAVVALGTGLFIVVLVIQLTVAWLFAEFKESVSREDAPLPALAAKERPRLPRDLRKIPPPVLQQSEIVDLKRLREAEDRQLTRYDWVDADAGVVRIPIAEAMRLLADRKTAAAHGIRVAAKKGGRR